MATNSGVEAGRLSVLAETLWEWNIAQERACRLWGWDDAPWWYGERASLSTFAGAIWRSGGIALEEYSVQKSNPESTKHTTLFSGRNDLYFKLGRSDFILEAKQYWPNMRSSGVLYGLSNALKAATKDVRSMKAEGARRLAAVFIAGRIPVKYMDEGEHLIESMIDSLREFKGAAKAWVFPDDANTENLVDGKLTRKWYPGAALVIAEV